MKWEAAPNDALQEYILPHIGKAGWVEDGSAISEEVPLSKRELLGLIALAVALAEHAPDRTWAVGFDPQHGEPNDGYVTDGDRSFRLEHKVVAQYSADDVLSEIIETYKKYAARGRAYGSNRVLLIHANQGDGRAVKVSALSDYIDTQPLVFDAVFLLGAVAQYPNRIVFHLFHMQPRKRPITQLEIGPAPEMLAASGGVNPDDLLLVSE